MKVGIFFPSSLHNRWEKYVIEKYHKPFELVAFNYWNLIYHDVYYFLLRKRLHSNHFSLIYLHLQHIGNLFCFWRSYPLIDYVDTLVKAYPTKFCSNHINYNLEFPLALIGKSTKSYVNQIANNYLVRFHTIDQIDTSFYWFRIFPGLCISRTM